MENNIPRKALGKGLEELFNSEPIDFTQVEEKIITTTPKDEIVMVKLADLRSNPYQPRKIFDEKALEELAESIKEHGVFQPIIVKPSIKGYEIIAGERRVKASILAGLTEIPAIIREFNDTEMMEIALLENLQREDLTPIEEANAYKKISETLNLTQEELSKRVGKSRSYITNTLGLLKLPQETQNLINEKKISMGHAKILSKLEDKYQIKELTDKIIIDGISVHELENITSSPDEYNRVNKNSVPKEKVKKDNIYSYLEDMISEKLGTKVKIKSNKIQISFTNSNDLNRLLEIMHLDK
ncbi:MAG: ParB/RepB/Spo0J family partition protein [Bacilli bacterium]|nr:ParB/RepB/Spo0J family partition protein [Bacilli bacterium]